MSNSTGPGLQSLTLPGDIAATILAHLRDWLPNEGCGLLAGRRDRDGHGRASRFFPGTNVLHSPTRYRMADPEVVNALRTNRELDLDLLAIVHSHPVTKPAPSATDRAELNYPGAALLIVSFRMPEPEWAAWALASGQAGSGQPDAVTIRQISLNRLVCL
jgi:proteasome lid subunit RPN8/RPN11